jgi:ferredoxin
VSLFRSFFKNRLILLANKRFMGYCYYYHNSERCDMAYTISDECINCGSCDSECSVEAISEKDNRRWIDPEKCQDCGACVGVCPVEAIAAG